jgi:elongation factor P
MLSISEVKVGSLVQTAGEPYIVLRAEHHKMGRGGAVLKIKLRNLVSGNTLDKTMQGNEKIEPAKTEKKKVNFMYADAGNLYFMDNDSYDQFSLPIEQAGDRKKFLKDGTDVDMLYFEDRPVAVELPIKMKFKVVSAPPGVRGNSAGNVTKKVVIETGAEITAPMFIEEGEEIIVNTEREEYVERAVK